MVVESSPASPFLVVDAKFALQVFVVAFDPPAPHRQFDGAPRRLHGAVVKQVIDRWVLAGTSVDATGVVDHHPPQHGREPGPRDAACRSMTRARRSRSPRSRP